MLQEFVESEVTLRKERSRLNAKGSARFICRLSTPVQVRQPKGLHFRILPEADSAVRQSTESGIQLMQELSAASQAALSSAVSRFAVVSPEPYTAVLALLSPLLHPLTHPNPFFPPLLEDLQVVPFSLFDVCSKEYFEQEWQWVSQRCLLSDFVCLFPDP